MTPMDLRCKMEGTLKDRKENSNDKKKKESETALL